MARKTGYTVTLKGGPRDGDTITLPWETITRGRLEVPVLGPAFGVPKGAIYVPCPTEPDTVWRLDARRSDTGIKLDGPKVCRVPSSDKEPATIFGIPVAKVDIDAVHRAMSTHYAEFGHAPERFEFEGGAAIVLPDDWTVRR